MDTNTFDCMETAGLITEAQRSAMVKAARFVPETTAGALAFLAVMAIAGQDGSAYSGIAIGTESVTSANTGDVQALTVPAGATRAVVSVHLNNIIFRIDGGVPAVGAGHIAAEDSNFSIGSLSDFKFVSAVAGNATIFVSYF